MKAHRWRFETADSSLVETLAHHLALAPWVARCLANRGCDCAEAAAHYVSPRLARLSDPFLLPNMEAAVERLFTARANHEQFVIFGDYDVDGVTATALLTEVFQTLGWRPAYYLPHRMDEGYGLTPDAVKNCLGRFDVKLILAVDCGSTSGALIRELGAQGVDVIVLDHHQTANPLPPCTALVNPQLLDGENDLKHLCSAGLAFKLAHALVKRGRERGLSEAHDFDLRPLLDFVALGTIADIVPLRGENRILVRAGLDRLNQTRREGLRALREISGITGEIGPYGTAFQLAPRLNASGRLETALASLELLLSKDSVQARRLAVTLDARNRERQEIEQRILDEVLSVVRTRFDPGRDFVIVEGRSSWHLGVVGIVASRVLREFHRPVVILGSDGSEEWRGSGRSIEGFDLAAGLRACSDLLLKHGGHAMAAGVTLAAAKVETFRERLNQLASAHLTPDSLLPALRLDGAVELKQLTFPAIKSLQCLEPTGHGNPSVQLAARNLALQGQPRLIGKAANHLRFSVTDGCVTLPAVWWNSGEIAFPSRFDLAFVPELNEYNGNIGIQLKALDLRASIDAA